MKNNNPSQSVRRIKIAQLSCALGVLTVTPLAMAEVTLLDDAYISYAAAAKNFGKTTTLNVVDGASDGYLRFDLAHSLPSGSPRVAKATLKVFISSIKKGTSGSLTVNQTTTLVDELVLTNTPPLAVGDVIGSAAASLNRWVTFDVTSYVSVHQYDESLAFALQGIGGLNVKIDSKEAKTTSHAPVLDIVWDNLGSFGYENTANGNHALANNTTGASNTAYGVYALGSNTAGSLNTAHGNAALYSNSTGSYNTAVGVAGLLSNTTGSNNTASGYQALYSNIEGEYNTALGNNASYANSAGWYNTAIGSVALQSNTTGSANTALGFGADVTASDLINATAIGSGAKVNASNKVRIGNTEVAVIEGQVPLTTTSDQRYKNHIQDLPLGVDFINRLRPVEYIRNNNQTQTKEWGVIAQELKQTLVDVDYKNAGIVSEDSTPQKYLTVRYNDFLAPMIKAIQEQQQTIQEQQKTIAALSKRIEALEQK